MSPTECVTIVELIDARCPSMRMADATADSWYLDLRDLDFADTYQAALDLTRAQRYVALCELLDAASKIQAHRITETHRLEVQRQIEAENGPEGNRTMAGITLGKPVT